MCVYVYINISVSMFFCYYTLQAGVKSADTSESWSISLLCSCCSQAVTSCRVLTFENSPESQIKGKGCRYILHLEPGLIGRKLKHIRERH